MKKYNIKENRPELSKADIEQGMDFSKINAKAGAGTGAKIFSLKTLLVSTVAAAAAITGVIYGPQLLHNGNEHGNTGVVQLPSQENIPDTFVVKVNKDTTLVYNTGSKINIPAGAFVNERGEPVQGDVKINYREFHKVSEILLAHIPMRYDSAGKEMYFESAGMFNISATQHNKPVYIAPDKSLEVTMASLDATEKKYNQYLLDEKTGKWKFIRRDAVALINKSDTAKTRMTAKADSVKRTAPVKPVNDRMFTIDAEGRPELSIYKNILFEVTKDCKTFNPEEAKTDWGMVNLEKVAGSKDKYKVTFSYPLSGPLRSYQVIAQPVKDGNMEAAMKKYDALYTTYRKALTEAEKADQLAQERLNREQGIYEDVFEKYQALQRQNAELYQARITQVVQAEQVVYRTFQVKQFGIWNSDCPQSMPRGVEVMAKFESKDGSKLHLSAVYLVEKGKNAMYNLYVPEKFSFNPEAENVLLVVTADGKLGWVKNDVFKLINNSTKNFTFKLELLDKEKYSPGDIDKIVA